MEDGKPRFRAPIAPSTSPEGRKKATSLPNLPNEILDKILFYALPNWRELEGCGDERVVFRTYLVPVLQVSRVFRRQCFNIIKKCTVWICIKDDLPPNGISENPPREGRETLPNFPVKFRYLIPHDAARVELNVCSKEDVVEFIFPFNFDSLLYFCSRVNLASGWKAEMCATIARRNMAGKLWQENSLLIVSAISQLRGFYKVAMRSERHPYDLNAENPILLGGDWNFDATMWRVQNITDCIDNLDRQGHVREADLLCLHSVDREELLNHAGHFVIHPAVWDSELYPEEEFSDFEPEELPPEESAPERSLQPDRTAKENQLRRSIVAFQVRACLAYSRFIVAHGYDWSESEQLRWIWPREANFYHYFLSDPRCYPFGTSDEELGRLYHARATLHLAVHQSRHKFPGHKHPPGPERWDDRAGDVELALVEMYMAHTVQPDNLEYETALEDLRARLPREARERGLTTARSRVVSVVYTPVGLDGETSTWRGDKDVLQRWGPEYLHCLPLAQK